MISCKVYMNVVSLLYEHVCVYGTEKTLKWSSHTPHMSIFCLLDRNCFVAFSPRVAGVVVHCLRLALLWMWPHRFQGSQAAAVSKTPRCLPLV